MGLIHKQVIHAQFLERNRIVLFSRIIKPVKSILEVPLKYLHLFQCPGFPGTQFHFINLLRDLINFLLHGGQLPLP